MCTEIPSTHIMPNTLTVPVTSKAVTLPLTTYTKPPFPVSHTATVPYDALSKGTTPYDVLSTVTTPYDALSTGTTPYDVLSTVTPPYDDLSTIVASETGDGNPMLKLAGAAMFVLFLVGVAGMIAYAYQYRHNARRRSIWRRRIVTPLDETSPEDEINQIALEMKDMNWASNEAVVTV